MSTQMLIVFLSKYLTINFEMDDFEEVRLREGKAPKQENKRDTKTEEAEILDEDEQQRIIDDLKKQYGSVMRSQKRVFRIITVLMSIFCVIIGFITHLHLQFVIPSLAFLFLLGFEKVKNMQCKLATGICEASFLIITLKFWGKATPYLWAAVHIIYFVMVAHIISTQNFAKSLPSKIMELQGMKYGPKLA